MNRNELHAREMAEYRLARMRAAGLAQRECLAGPAPLAAEPPREVTEAGFGLCATPDWSLVLRQHCAAGERGSAISCLAATAAPPRVEADFLKPQQPAHDDTILSRLGKSMQGMVAGLWKRRRAARRRALCWGFVEAAAGAACLLALTLTLAQPAGAASGTYTNTASGGLWSNGGNWSGGAVADGSGFTADFNTLDITADNTVHLDTARTIGNLTFGDTATGTAAGWILDNNGTASNVLTLAGGNIVTVNTLGTGKSVTISAIIAGTNVDKRGAGTLTLTGANTFTGSLFVGITGAGGGTVNLNASGGNAASGTLLQIGGGNYTSGGTVNLLGANQINDSAQVSLNGNYLSGHATLNLNGFSETIKGLSGSSSGTSGPGGTDLVNHSNTNVILTINTAGSNFDYGGGDRSDQVFLRDRSSATSTGTLGLTKQGTGTQTIGSVQAVNSNVTYSGPTAVEGGTLTLRNTNNFNSDISISSGATLGLNTTTAGQTAVITSAISGPGTISKSGAGISLLTGSSSYTGAISVTAGTLQIGGSGRLNSGAYANTISLASGTSLQYSSSTSQTITGIISGTSGNVLKDGGSTLTLAGASVNTYTGGTTVNGGKLLVDFSASTPTSNMINSGSVLTLGGGNFEAKGKAATANSQTFASTTLTAGTDSIVTSTQNGATSLFVDLKTITVGAGATLNFVTPGTAASQIRTTNGSANTALGNWAIFNGSGVAAKDATNTFVVALSTYNQNVPVLGGSIANVATDNVKIVDPGSTAGNITLVAAGTTTINSLVHAATLNPGTIATASKTLVLDNAASGAIGNFLMGPGTSALTVGAAANDGFLTAGSAGAATLVLSNESANNMTINAKIANNAGAGVLKVVKEGVGTTIFGAANTYTGATVVNGGTLRANAATTAFGVGSAVTLNAGTIDLNGFSQNVGSLAGPATTTVLTSASAATLTTGGANTSTTYSGSITGAVSLTQKGTGYLTLDGTVSNTASGTLIVAAGSNAGTSGVKFGKMGGAVAWSGTVQMGDATATQGNLKMYASNQFGSGAVMNFSNTSGNWMRFDLQGTDQTLAGLNAGTSATQAGAVIQNQALDGVDPFFNSVLTLNGSSTYLYNGYLRDQDNGGATRKLALTWSGSGTQTLVGSVVTYSGDTNVSAGTLKLSNTNAFNSNIILSNNANVVLERTTSTWILAKTISGTGTVNANLTGGGVIYLEGADSYSGQTTVTGGNGYLVARNNTSLGTTAGDTVISNGNTLQLENSITITGEAVTLNGLGVGGTRGALAGWTGNNTWTGSVTMATDSGIYAETAGTFNVTGVIGESGGARAMTKQGGGTLVLTNANTYSGGTNISAGTLALSGGNDRLLNTRTVKFTGTSTFDVGSTSQSITGLSVDDGFTGTVNGSGGTLTVNATGNFVVGGTGIGTSQTLNMAGLSNFEFKGSAFAFNVAGQYAVNNASAGSSGTVTLGDFTKITAASIGIANQTRGASANSNYNSGTLNLGQTTELNANTIKIGAYEAQGTVQFRGGLVNPTLKIRDTAGTGRAAINFGVLDGSGVNFNTGTSTWNTSAGSIDAMVSTLTVGRNDSQNQSSAAFNQSFTTGAGTLDATTIVIGQNGGASGGIFATMTASGTTVKTQTLTIGTRTAGSGNFSANFNLNSGGILQAQTVGPGATAGLTRNFTWNDGTIKNYDSSTDLTIQSGLTTLNLAGAGLHAFDISNGRQGTVNQAMSGTGGLTKNGNGTLTVTGANTYGGTTNVAAGTLRLNGTHVGAGAYTVQSGATLGGTGSTDAALTVNGGGHLAPGMSPSIMSFGSVTLLAGANYDVDLWGTTVGSGYDRTNVTSGVLNVTGAVLNLDFNGGAFTPVAGNTFTIFDKQSAGAVTGTFAGLANNSVFSQGGNAFGIRYDSDTANVNGFGNDVTLYSLGASGTPGTLYASTQPSWATDPAFTAVDGNEEAAGTQTAYLTYSAFTSINAGLSAYSGYGGPMVVNGGAYAAASLAGGGAVELRLVDGLVANNVTIQSLSGDAADSIKLNFQNGVTGGNLLAESGSFAGTISGNGTVTKTTGGTLTLAGANTFTGGVTLSAGVLNINAGGAGPTNSALGSGTFTINGGNIDNTSGGLVTLATNNAQAWNSSFAFLGSNSLNMGTGPVALGTNVAVTVNANTLTVGGAIGDGASTYSLTKQGAGTLRLTGASTYGGATNVAGGTLQLAAGGLENSNVNVTSGTFQQTGGVNNVTGAGTGNLAVTGAGSKYQLQGGTLDFGDYQAGDAAWAPSDTSAINLETGSQFEFTGGTLQNVSNINLADSSTFTQNGGVFVIGQDGIGPAALTSVSGGFSLIAGLVRFDAFGADLTPEQCCDDVPSQNDQLTVEGNLLLDSLVSINYAAGYEPEFGDAFTLFCADLIQLGPNFGVEGGFYRVVETGDPEHPFALQVMVPEPVSVAVWTLVGLAGAAGAWRSRRGRKGEGFRV